MKGRAKRTKCLSVVKIMSKAVERMMRQFSMSMKHSKELMDSVGSLAVRALREIVKKMWTAKRKRARI